MADKLIDLVRTLSAPLDDIEIGNEELKNVLNIETAVGDQLDLIGAIVGEPKLSGLTTSQYRDRIKRKILLHTGTGDHETMIRAGLHYSNASSVTVVEYNTNVQVGLIGLTSIPTQDQLRQIKSYSAAGVGLFILYVTATPFQYDNPSGYGYADSLGNGGNYAGLLGSK